MKSIKSLIEELNLLRNSWEFKSLSLIDEHITALESRVRGLEAKNMRYYAKAWRSTAQLIPQNVVTLVQFNSTLYPQFGNMHDNINVPERIYIRRTGVYYIYACVQWEANAVGSLREITIQKISNGVITELSGQSGAPAGANILHQSLPAFDYLYEGDYIALTAFTNGPVGGLNIESHEGHSPVLAVSERLEDLNPSEYGLLNPSANMR